jgi:ribosomal protein S6
VAIWYWSLANNVDEAKTIIQTAGNMGELMKRVKKDNHGYYFIDFTAAKGDSIQRFKEFQKLDAKTVRIYLGKASK